MKPSVMTGVPSEASYADQMLANSSETSKRLKIIDEWQVVDDHVTRMPRKFANIPEDSIPTPNESSTRSKRQINNNKLPKMQVIKRGLILAIGLNILAPLIGSYAMLMNLPDGIENILGFVPKSSFKCERDGYFGDIDNDCRLFHLCQKQISPTGQVEWGHWTYACGNQTMFNQLTLTCAFVDEAIPCRHATQFQYLNEVIHKPREPFLTDADVTSGISYYSNRIMSDGARARAFEDSHLMAQIGHVAVTAPSSAILAPQSHFRSADQNAQNSLEYSPAPERTAHYSSNSFYGTAFQEQGFPTGSQNSFENLPDGIDNMASAANDGRDSSSSLARENELNAFNPAPLKNSKLPETGNSASTNNHDGAFANSFSFAIATDHSARNQAADNSPVSLVAGQQYGQTFGAADNRLEFPLPVEPTFPGGSGNNVARHLNLDFPAAFANQPSSLPMPPPPPPPPTQPVTTTTTPTITSTSEPQTASPITSDTNSRLSASDFNSPATTQSPPPPQTGSTTLPATLEDGSSGSSFGPSPVTTVDTNSRAPITTGAAPTGAAPNNVETTTRPSGSQTGGRGQLVMASDNVAKPIRRRKVKQSSVDHDNLHKPFQSVRIAATKPVENVGIIMRKQQPQPQQQTSSPPSASASGRTGQTFGSSSFLAQPVDREFHNYGFWGKTFEAPLMRIDSPIIMKRRV